jgi:hypothetical protein
MRRVVFMQADDPLAYFKNPSSSGVEVLLLIGAVVVIAAIFFIWAAYVRRPRKMHHTYRHLHQDNGGRRKRSGLSRLFGRKHRRRRKHSQERSVNPTLAQIGGLPAKREEHQPPS